MSRCSDNIRFAKQLGAKVVKLKGSRVADALVEFAKREGITHVIFGQSARSRWDLLVHGSIVDRFLRDVRNATVQIVPVRGRGSAPKTMRLTGERAMKLRTKLLLGYAGFVLALGVLGAWSARTLSQMSAVSGRIIAENYDSVVAAQDMKESLERQDSAALFDLLGQRDRARRQVAEHRARFDAALEKAAANITEPGEAEVIAAIRARPRRVLPALRRLPDAPRRSHRAVLSRRSSRSSIAVRADCDRLLRLNQEAMRRKADAAVAHRAALVLCHAGAGARADGGRHRRRAQPVERDRRARFGS